MRSLPVRQPGDGPVSVQRVDGDRITMRTEPPGGDAQWINVSEYNAARLLAMLCIMLELPIPKALGKMKM